MLKFSVAVARGFKKEDGTDWLNCCLFGERGEKLAQYLVKGTKVLVEGALRINKYEGKDGVIKYSSDIMVNTIEFTGGKNENTSSKQTSSNDFGSDSGITPVDDSDIPFK